MGEVSADASTERMEDTMEGALRCMEVLLDNLRYLPPSAIVELMRVLDRHRYAGTADEQEQN